MIRDPQTWRLLQTACENIALGFFPANVSAEIRKLAQFSPVSAV